MQYRIFYLDEESQELCAIIAPFGKYKYKSPPMGLKCAPAIAQQVMEHVLCRHANVKVYLDDIDVLQHLKYQVLFNKVLSHLRTYSFTINSLECEWTSQETVWLRNRLTQTGPKSWKKCISAILEQEPPGNIKEMRSFLSAINTYWLM